MRISYFPYIASTMGLIMLFVVTKGSSTNTDGTTVLPLLTLLLMSEFAFIVTAIGAYAGYREMKKGGYTVYYVATTILCILLSILFAVLGVRLWPL